MLSFYRSTPFFFFGLILLSRFMFLRILNYYFINICLLHSLFWPLFNFLLLTIRCLYLNINQLRSILFILIFINLMINNLHNLYIIIFISIINNNFLSLLFLFGLFIVLFKIFIFNNHNYYIIFSKFFLNFYLRNFALIDTHI